MRGGVGPLHLLSSWIPSHWKIRPSAAILAKIPTVLSGAMQTAFPELQFHVCKTIYDDSEPNTSAI